MVGLAAVVAMSMAISMVAETAITTNMAAGMAAVDIATGTTVTAMRDTRAIGIVRIVAGGGWCLRGSACADGHHHRHFADSWNTLLRVALIFRTTIKWEYLQWVTSTLPDRHSP